jgi:hypothetical protein
MPPKSSRLKALTEKDVHCTRCGARSRAGFRPSETLCPQGEHLDSRHKWEPIFDAELNTPQ